MYKFTVKEIFDLSSIPAKVLFGEASYCRYQGVLYCDNVKITIDHYVFNEIDEKKASIKYINNYRQKTTFNIAAEIARLVKRSTFATAKDRIFIVPFLGSRNGVNSAYS